MCVTLSVSVPGMSDPVEIMTVSGDVLLVRPRQGVWVDDTWLGVGTVRDSGMIHYAIVDFPPGEDGEPVCIVDFPYEGYEDSDHYMDMLAEAGTVVMGAIGRRLSAGETASDGFPRQRGR